MVVVRIGMGRKASFLANSTAIGKKSNAADRPSPCCHQPQGFVQRVPREKSIYIHEAPFALGGGGK